MKLWELLGRGVFWLSWPVSFVALTGSQRARVLVEAEGKILLVKSWHGTGKWTLPGGGIHAHEDQRMAATRELMEETGVALGIDQLQKLTEKQQTDHGFHYTAVYYAARLDQIIPAYARFPEIVAAEWVPHEDLARYPIDQTVQTALTARR